MSSDDLIMQYLPEPNAFLKKFMTDKGNADLATGSTKMAFKLSRYPFSDHTHPAVAKIVSALYQN